jgi:hypothetical protein
VEVHLLCDSLLDPFANEGETGLQEELCCWLRSASCYSPKEELTGSIAPAGHVFPPGDTRPARALLGRLEPYVASGGRWTYDCFVSLFVLIHACDGLLEISWRDDLVNQGDDPEAAVREWLLSAAQHKCETDDLRVGSRVKIRTMNMRFKDAVILEIKEQHRGFAAGTRVTAYYQLYENGGKSDVADHGHVVDPQGQEPGTVRVCFDDNVEQDIDATWILDPEPALQRAPSVLEPGHRVVVETLDGWREELDSIDILGKLTEEPVPPALEVRASGRAKAITIGSQL